MTDTRHVTSRDGTAIAYSVRGTGPTLVLVDPAGAYRLAGPMVALAGVLASDFTVVTFDRRGRGESGDTAPYAVDREIDDLEAVIGAAGGSAFVHGFSSGAVLALFAAARGVPIERLSLLEPPLELDPSVTPDTELEQELAALIADGRRGDAFEHFNRAIGVPEEYLSGMRDAPTWPAYEALAHTLVYDCVIGRTPAPDLAQVTIPTLVVHSEATDDQLRGWATALAAALPNATLRSLPGEWHGVADDILAPALVEFFARPAPVAPR